MTTPTRIDKLRAARIKLERKDRVKAVLIGIAIVACVVAAVVLGGVIMMLAWNLGVVPALGGAVAKINVVAALALNAFLLIVGAFFRRSA